MPDGCIMVAMTRLALAPALAALCAFPAFAGGGIGYAQATGYLKQDTRPTLYQPLNLLDARENTAWCSPSADPLNEQLFFGFKESAKIDEVRVYTGNGFSEQTFQEFARGKKFAIKGPAGAQAFTVADQRGFQAIALTPPIVGSEVIIEVLDQYPAEDPDASVCVTDFVFFSEGRALNGNWLSSKLKYDKHRAPFLGTWYAGYDGAPDRFLSFFFDGTYGYHFDPFDKDQAKEKSFQGSFEVSGARLSLEVPGKGRVSARVHTAARAGGKPGRSLDLEGDLPEDLKRPFRSVR